MNESLIERGEVKKREEGEREREMMMFKIFFTCTTYITIPQSVLNFMTCINKY